MDLPTSIHSLADELNIAKAEIPNLNNQAAYYHSQLRTEHRDYLHKRGINDETINALLIGYCEHDGFWHNRITIPYWKNGNVVYFVARALDDDPRKYMKMKLDEYNQHVIWGLNSLVHDSSELIIAEGAFDAISAFQDGYKVLSPATGRFSTDQMKDLLRILKHHTGDIIICLDYDPVSETGQKASWELAFKLFQNNIDCKVVNFAGGNQKVDLNDLYARGQSIKNIISGATDFIEMYIQEASEADMYRLARERSLVKYKELIDPELFKCIQKTPPDTMIAEEVTHAHKLAYHDKLDWYEYDNVKGLWEPKTDNDIRAYISNTLKRFSKGGIINSILVVLKAMCNYNGEFDTETNYLNFTNGMLDLKSMRTDSHDPEFMCATQLGYKYDKDAKCPKWEKFISSVSDGDNSRALLLQEMFGYCFTRSTEYQKMFFLLGTGSNGKSVLLKILEELLGRNNVSYVPLTGLADDFQRILLHNKSVNIVSELKTRIEQVNQILKAIVDGETIQGAYKYKPHMLFKPYCKIICAGNEMFTSEDVSHGFGRRLIFCKFPVRFEGAERDLNIKDKLMSELPGIFNWSLAGLARLNEQGGFTETSDQAEMMKSFMSLSDTSYDFFEDLGEFDFTPRPDLYRKYTLYCVSNGAHPMSSRKLYERVRTNPKIKEYKSNGTWGFKYKKRRTVQEKITD